MSYQQSRRRREDPLEMVSREDHRTTTFELVAEHFTSIIASDVVKSPKLP